MTGDWSLEIKVDHILRVRLDKLLSRLDLFAHEDGEGLVGGQGVAQGDAAQGAGLGVHRGFPQLVGVHFAQALEAADVDLDVGAFAAQLCGDRVALLVGVGHALGLATAQLIQRRHGRVDVAVLDQRPHIAEEEGQHQRAEVAWNRGKIENINAIFGIKIYNKGEKPTNGELIALVADKILIESL